MEFSRQEYWSGFSKELPDPGIEPRSPALQAVSLLSEPAGKPKSHLGEWQFPDTSALQFWAKWASSSHRRPQALAVGSNTIFRGKSGKMRKKGPRRSQRGRAQIAQSFWGGGTLPQKIRTRHHDVGLHQHSVKCQLMPSGTWLSLELDSTPPSPFTPHVSLVISLTSFSMSVKLRS